MCIYVVDINQTCLTLITGGLEKKGTKLVEK